MAKSLTAAIVLGVSVLGLAATAAQEKVSPKAQLLSEGLRKLLPEYEKAANEIESATASRSAPRSTGVGVWAW